MQPEKGNEKDIAMPVADLDRKLKTGIKKSLRGIREIEKRMSSP